MRSGTRRYDVVKRCLDVIFSGVLLVLISPLIAILALLVRFNLGAPVLFSQERPGKDAQPFRILKFRSMRSMNEEAGLVTDEDRLTGFGRALRASSLDELPALANVFRGDMSFVGPRPLLLRYVPLYSQHQSRRHEVRPGITGLAQVSGRNSVDWEQRFDLDVEYVDNRSFGLDLRIILRTIGVVLSRRGVAAEGHSTMPEFRGSASEDDAR